MMKKKAAAAIVMLAILCLVPLGCSFGGEDDEQAIRSLVNRSSYTNEDHTRSYGAEDSTPTGGGDTFSGPGADRYDTIPFVRFRRYIPPGGVSRTIVVNIPAYPGYPDTTALAVVTSEINGEFRTMFDTTTNSIPVWRKPFTDQAVRKVYLTKDVGGWHIRKVSPLEFSTVDAAYELRITEIKVHAASWAGGDTFRVLSADTMLAKHDLPAFVPEDTVTVWIAVSSTGDSCWTFLHHGRPKWPHRWRRPYFKTNTLTFERTWYIGPEGYETPQVRPSGHDAIGWSTLWADSSEPYVATAWGIPYVVREPGEELPEE